MLLGLTSVNLKNEVKTLGTNRNHTWFRHQLTKQFNRPRSNEHSTAILYKPHFYIFDHNNFNYHSIDFILKESMKSLSKLHNSAPL